MVRSFLEFTHLFIVRNQKMLQVCQDCPSVSILICQNKRVHHTTHSKKIFIANKHMANTTRNALTRSSVHTEHTSERLMLRSRQSSKASEPVIDLEMPPTFFFVHICRIRISAWLRLLSPAVQRFGLEACLQSFERMPWEQAAAENQVNTDC